MQTKRHAAFLLLLTFCAGSAALAADQVKTANGILEGTGAQASGIRMFRGVPYAQPPVGDFRWKAPQPLNDWTGVRQAQEFGPRCMQQPLFGDMNFRSDGMSEDCLYLNVWTPAKSDAEKLPVLVYYYGGGFAAGDGSEPRYDGESLARRGIVTVTVNYRLGVFGFLAHPELTAEAPYHASGNYALLDQAAALKWVHDNVAAFGGDPGKITIGGESAGSASVSGLMASPVSKDLIAGAIGESGSLMGTLTPVPLAKAEQQGVEFAKSLGADSIAALRAMPTDKVEKANTGVGRFNIVVDGYFFPEPVDQIFASGKQAHVPLLVGWNSSEMPGMALLHGDATPENYRKLVETRFGARAGEVLKLYPGNNKEGVMQSATDLATDNFIAFSTWNWFNYAVKTGGQPVYRYFYERGRPAMRPEMGNATAGLAGGVIKGTDSKARTVPAPAATGAVHSAEIEYALGNLDSNEVYAWTPDDHAVSKTMEEYFADFIKTGNPNGPGVPNWPADEAGKPVEVMHIGVHSQAEPEQHRDRYLYWDQTAQPH